MIVVKLKELSQAKGYATMSAFQRASGSTMPTVRRWWKDDIKALDLAVLDHFCAFLKCEPGDLIKREVGHKR